MTAPLFPDADALADIVRVASEQYVAR